MGIVARRKRKAQEVEIGISFILMLLFLACYVFRSLQITVLVFSIILVLARLLWLKRKQKERQRLLLADSLALSPTEFEQRVAMLLTDLGWQNVQLVGGSGDGGVDIRAENDGFRYVVQCKRYKGLVEPTHIRDLAGTLTHEKADRGLLITTGHVSDQTRAWIKGKPVFIWDGSLLGKQIARSQNSGIQQLLQQKQRKRTMQLVWSLAIVNVFSLALLFVPATTTAEQPPISPNTPTAGETVIPTNTTIPTNTAVPIATAIALSGTVANGGNVRAEPKLDGAILDQIHAYETVRLLERNADWVQIINAREIRGWVHISLLTIEPSVLEAVPQK